MSSMLEQAIIDAAALRETAMKNAESTLVEKYKEEFEKTLERLLEQEEVTPPDPPEMSADAAAANAEDPTGPTVTDEPDMDMTNFDSAPTAPQSKAFDKVKSAFFDLDGDDEELITINFDGLKANPQVSSGMMLSAPPQADMGGAPMMENLDLDEEIELELEAYDMNGGNGSYGGHSSGVDSLEEDEELEEEIELEEDSELQETGAVVDPTSAKDMADAARLKKQASEKEAAASLKNAAATEKSQKEVQPEEEVELTEEELNELEEELRVDMSVQPEGYMGSHKRKERENKAIAYAAARDDKKKQKREEYAKKVEDLQEALSLSESQNNQLLSAIKVLKEQIEKTNISNAKLLYTNKVLSNVSLNERQKNSIVENITKASSVLEAKTIYETLQSTVGVRTEKAPKSLSEAINRKNSPFLARKEPAVNSEIFSDRLKALAGIKK